jgi:tRNA pseudouridine38-40 synthase
MSTVDDMRKYKAVVEYDGTDFFGFQVQAEGRTVQSELEAALGELAGRRVRVVGAGRTDSGVHAKGQVIAFSLAWRHDPEALRRAINARLADDVALLHVEPVAQDFHPRYDAVRRHYQYRILSRGQRSPLERRYAWHVRKPLDVPAMNRAACVLVGEHDLATFGRPPQGANTRRRVFRAEWRRHDSLVMFDIEANAFLYRMVRSIVGSLVLVGRGELSERQFGDLLAARNRSVAGPTAPPHGLYLMAVHY